MDSAVIFEPTIIDNVMPFDERDDSTSPPITLIAAILFAITTKNVRYAQPLIDAGSIKFIEFSEAPIVYAYRFKYPDSTDSKAEFFEVTIFSDRQQAPVYMISIANRPVFYESV